MSRVLSVGSRRCGAGAGWRLALCRFQNQRASAHRWWCASRWRLRGMSTGTAGSAGWFAQWFRTFRAGTGTGCTRLAVLVVVADPDGAAGPIFERDEMTDTMSDPRFAAATPHAPQTEYVAQDQSDSASQHATQTQTQTPNGLWARAERSLPV